jgi:ferredoxin
MSCEPKSIQIKVYADRCVAAGHCVICAPAIFSQNDSDGVVVLLDESPPLELREAAQEAARLCPTSAIEVIEHW